MSVVTDWLLALMVAFAPPERAEKETQFPGFEETTEERTARYQSIAADLNTFVYHPDTKSVFAGKKGRARTAALLLAIAYHESGFAKDVDVGPCYRGKHNNGARCDHGLSACLMQIRLGKGQTAQGYSQADLFADRKKCFEAGLGLVRGSFSACKQQPLKHRLNAYASGSCEKGQAGSERLMALAARFEARVEMPGPDEKFVEKKDAPPKTSGAP